MITNILMTKKWYVNCYLPRNDSKVLQPVFPTANLAIRKEAINEIGMFDTDCNISGEDTDLCIRVSKTKWEIFFESRAVVRHKHRTTLRGLLKQWYGYGLSQPYLFKKHTPKCLEVCYHDKKSDATWSAVQYYKILGIPVRIYALIFISSFHILNLILILALLAAALGWHTLSMVLLGGWLLGWMYYWGEDFFKNVIIKRDLRWLIYSFLRHILNLTLMCGYLKGLKMGVLYLGPTPEKTPSVEDNGK